MSRHHLDPRQAGTGAKPDLTIISWGGDWTVYAYHSCTPTLPEPYLSEQEALTAARAAAGFEHVTERACNSFVNTHGQSEWCSTCAWDRGAHVKKKRVVPA